jgi:DNA-binding Lrp family transcriptional regulator
VLIRTERGAEDEVLDGLMLINDVKDASLVYGEFDIFCRIEVADMGKLREVNMKIRKLKIRTTETLIAFKKAQRVGKLSNRRREKIWRNRSRR